MFVTGSCGVSVWAKSLEYDAATSPAHCDRGAKGKRIFRKQFKNLNRSSKAIMCEIEDDIGYYSQGLKGYPFYLLTNTIHIIFLIKYVIRMSGYHLWTRINIKFFNLTLGFCIQDSELTELRQTIELLRKQSIQAGLTTAHMQSMGIRADGVNVTGQVRKHWISNLLF